ncbi:MAG: UDP-N-acetylmuramate dehydrogenase [Coriobacteriales bacterium]|jgi:UDP-N-acetylmuramate dehydrogenase|nr:UDP-N-acetylmuramate dehydrogenase [Coriobacteriales bacterium]
MSSFDAYCELQGMLEGHIFCDEPMVRHTSFRVGGPADLFIECASVRDLNFSLDVIARHQLPWAVVGKGSNLLVSDEGFRGAVLVLGAQFKSFSLPDLTCSQNKLVAGGGVQLSTLVQAAFKNGLSGFEFAVGIPGTLGGAVFMNAGSSDVWIGSIVESLTVLRPGEGLVRYQGSELPWGYRCSGLPAGEVIVECVLRVTPGHVGMIRAGMEASLTRRKKTQPLTTPNAGSIFRNPEGDSAGRIIEGLGLKGYTHGGAQVSEVHANFIVNTGNATASDVVAIIMHIRRRVREEHGIELRPEIRFIGFET